MSTAELMVEFPLRSEWDCSGERRRVVGYSRDNLMMATGKAGAESVSFVAIAVARTCRRIARREL